MLVLRASTTHLHCIPLDCQTRSWPDALILSTQLGFTLNHESFQLVLLLFTTTDYFPFRNLDQHQQGIMTWWALTNDQH